MRVAFDTSASRVIGIVFAAGGLAVLAAPAMAQAVDELTVTGHYGSPDNIRQLSRAVNYSDLDLTTQAGADALKVRVKDTARDLCTQLGETSTVDTVVPSCQRQAAADAMSQVSAAIASASPRAPMTAGAAVGRGY